MYYTCECGIENSSPIYFMIVVTVSIIHIGRIRIHSVGKLHEGQLEPCLICYQCIKTIIFPS